MFDSAEIYMQGVLMKYKFKLIGNTFFNVFKLE